MMFTNPKADINPRRVSYMLACIPYESDRSRQGDMMYIHIKLSRWRKVESEQTHRSGSQKQRRSNRRASHAYR
eukprot:761201-Hanusia_phi.AAC.1